MDEILKKLNYKEHPRIFAINAPESFNSSLQSADATIVREVKEGDKIDFAICFAITQAQVNAIAEQIAPKLQGDAIFWICYPKGTSKKYKCDFNRDTGWDVLGNFDLEGVRMVAIDEDWSALRFRKVFYIKTLQRNEKMAISSEGKSRTKKEGV